jgi:site-specific recombinase XerD
VSSILEIYQQLCTADLIPLSQGKKPDQRRNDIKTALTYLAKAYDTRPDQLVLTPEVESTYPQRLRAYLMAENKGHSTIRNAIQGVGQFLRAFHQLKQTAPVPRAPIRTRPRVRAVKLEAGATSPYRVRYLVKDPYSVQLTEWPVSVREGWERFCDARGIDLRPVTLKTYRSRLESYMSYNLRLDRSPITSWGELFEMDRLLRFVAWHAKRMGAKRISAMGRQVFRVVTMLARHDERPEYAGLLARERKLPPVEPMHDKQSPEHTISAQELEQVAMALLAEAERPLATRASNTRRYGLSRAGKHRDALLVRLMWRVPLRSRSICEMDIDKNLVRDHEGRWVLQYSGEQLKVAQRGGRTNTFRVPFPPELVRHLEDYLEKARPMFPNAETSPRVFLTQKGRAFHAMTLRQLVSDTVYFHTKKRLYPHLLRTLWVDQYLLSTDGDVSTAAFWLNDNVLTVLKRYHELRGKDHTQKASQFNQAILSKGNGNGRANRQR